MSLVLLRWISRRTQPSLVRFKQPVDRSKIPTLNEADLEEEFVRGSGPGGQAVARTSNAVILKHKPTGLIIKCHQTRSLERNRILARELLISRLDCLINGDMSIEAQEQRISDKKSRENARRSQKLHELKKKFKEREGVE